MMLPPSVGRVNEICTYRCFLQILQMLCRDSFQNEFSEPRIRNSPRENIAMDNVFHIRFQSFLAPN